MATVLKNFCIRCSCWVEGLKRQSPNGEREDLLPAENCLWWFREKSLALKHADRGEPEVPPWNRESGRKSLHPAGRNRKSFWMRWLKTRTYRMVRWSLAHEIECGGWRRGKRLQGLISNVSKGQRKEIIGSKKIWNPPEKVTFLRSCQLENVFILASHLISSLAGCSIYVWKTFSFRILKTFYCLLALALLICLPTSFGPWM